MANIVCFDTMIVIWGVKNKAYNGQEYLIDIAKKLIQELEVQGTKVIIPSPVIGELLAPLPKNEHSAFLDKFGRNMPIVSYDLKCAAICAEMLEKNTKNGIFEQIKKEDPLITRNHLKVDFMIAAAAVANGATKLFTGDSHLIKFCPGFIETQTLENYPSQLNLI